MNELKFGFLPYKFNINNEIFEINTLSSIEESFNCFKSRLIKDNSDYVYYPNYKEQLRLPSSHILKLKNKKINDKYFLYYLIHVIGFNFNQWVMPDNYWFDGTVKLNSIEIKEIQENYLEDLIKSSIKSYQSIPQDCKYRNTIISALYSYNSYKKFKWEFEWLFELYKSFDALWQYSTCCLKNNELIKQHMLLKKEIKSKHERRLKTVYKFLEISESKLPNNILDKIYKLRNELVHEARWDGEIIGHKLSDKKTFMAVIQFSSFVRKFMKFALTNDKLFNFPESNLWNI
ncbi:hypothetical protein CP965_10415 [Halarcobacter mediterraneus]|uniref:Apea-like HEPN domain-containing protein n=1 Tax=Halarcobacter mediterraneus TaxID=2023153 RepID=A0A4Q1ATW5_9BACT|nr:hypothetical protein [Halarcobacter mediterraneus]RXK12183.1 hypothetical protein CP965_10415 [Halarcobacter mediterraneus]